MNFYAIRTHCRAILNLWKQRFLSLAGKIQFFKSLIASKSAYVATMKHLPQEILDDLQSMHKDFICDGKRAKIKHCTLIGNCIDGGLKDVDLVSKFTSLKFIWIRKMLDKKLSSMGCTCRLYSEKRRRCKCFPVKFISGTK